MTRRELALYENLPAPTPELARTLSPQALDSHREKIRFSVQTVLSAYYQPNCSPEVQAAQLAWWCDELEDWEIEQVKWALSAWNRENPRTRPTPGDILKICKDEWGRRYAASIRRLPLPETRDGPSPSDPAERKRIAAELVRSFLNRE